MFFITYGGALMESTKKLQTISGAALAFAAAGLFLTAGMVPVAAADDAKIQCSGVNACKGKAECKTAKNDCKGQNACKGQGHVTLSEKDCKTKGGKPEKS
jgi:hypothetical protein